MYECRCTFSINYEVRVHLEKLNSIVGRSLSTTTKYESKQNDNGHLPNSNL